GTSCAKATSSSSTPAATASRTSACWSTRRKSGSSTPALRMASWRPSSTTGTSGRDISAPAGWFARRSRAEGAGMRLCFRLYTFMTRVVTALALLALAAAALFCALPVRTEQRLPAIVVHGRVALELLGVGSLRAGAGKARIALGPNPVLAGYPGKRRADDATEPVYARAIALEVEGLRVLIGSIDTLLVPGSLEEEVMRRA